MRCEERETQSDKKCSCILNIETHWQDADSSPTKSLELNSVQAVMV